MKQLASTKTGIEAVLDVTSVYDVQPSQDGLEFASPNDFGNWKIDGVTMPERLREFIEDLRVLRRIPISYLVPDAAMLPPESIRFFWVDQTWIDRVIDGVFSNTNVGTVDFHYNLTSLQAIRDALTLSSGMMTGILIRSELARRWPKMTVDAYSVLNAGVDAPGDIKVLRAEPISRDIFIALFDGRPRRLHIREPFEGVRFGVEGQFPNYNVDRRDAKGIVQNDDVTIAFRDLTRRTLNIENLRNNLTPANMQDARGVALHLEQRPFVQVFLDNVSETKGSVAPPLNLKVALRNGKLFTLKFATQALFQDND